MPSTRLSFAFGTGMLLCSAFKLAIVAYAGPGSVAPHNLLAEILFSAAFGMIFMAWHLIESREKGEANLSPEHAPA